VAQQGGDLRWLGDEVSQAVQTAVIRGLKIGAEHILQESRTLVPLDEGTLERSGTVVMDESELEALILYDTPYAVEQHEDLWFEHAPGRSAKYLEGPMHYEFEAAMALVAAQVRRATRSG